MVISGLIYIKTSTITAMPLHYDTVTYISLALRYYLGIVITLLSHINDIFQSSDLD